MRRLAGPKLARRLGRWYRAIFVDLSKEAAALASVIPPGARLLDIGGGDGEPLNHLLDLRPDLKVTTIDPAPDVGQWIEARFAGNVLRLPRTSLADYLERSAETPDALLMSDVMHHIPDHTRPMFLGSLRKLLDRAPRLRIIVKDVEPGHWRARLGYWSDRYITGDRGVSPISRERLTQLLAAELGPLHCEETGLFEADRPNYALVFFR